MKFSLETHIYCDFGDGNWQPIEAWNLLLARVAKMNSLAQGVLWWFTQWLWVEHPTFQLRSRYSTTAGNTMTFLTVITFNQLQSKPLVCLASPLPPYWAVWQRNLLTFQATPGRDSGSTSACLWPWSEGTPLAYWPVCKFDLILTTLSALTSVPACHLLLFNE